MALLCLTAENASLVQLRAKTLESDCGFKFPPSHSQLWDPGLVPEQLRAHCSFLICKMGLQGSPWCRGYSEE